MSTGMHQRVCLSAGSANGLGAPVWIDRRTRRLARLMLWLSGQEPTLAWSGPVSFFQTALRRPVSWFQMPATGHVGAVFIDALNQALEEDAGSAREDALMKRLLAAYTGTAPHADRCGMPRAKLVVIVDERVSSGDPFSGSERERRERFRSLLWTVRCRHPGEVIWVVRSADGGSGAWLSDTLKSPALRDTCTIKSPHTFRETLPDARHVYTLGATEGLYALLGGVTVHVFGTPYYAGWGLTDDCLPQPGRRFSPTRGALFYAIFVRLARYVDPATHVQGQLEAVIASIELQNEVAQRYGDIDSITACGFQLWKRPFVRPFLEAGRARVRWTGKASAADARDYIAMWGAMGGLTLLTGKRLTVEDGFLHSCGLGSDLSTPRSQVMDRTGIYFDPQHPGDLVALLNEATFDEAELDRARALRESIVAAGLTKYNLGRRRPAWTPPAGVRVVLVPGQVADDASVCLGCPDIHTIEALLVEVRKRRPHTWLVYRPHPDVTAGNRDGLGNDAPLQAMVDMVDTEADIVSLIEVADEVHTLTSLVGFDALLRDKAVFTYGMPFYAGWGLTHDAITDIPARARPLTLDMLTAGALLRYPLYRDWELGVFTTPEAVVSLLAVQACRPHVATRWHVPRGLTKAWRWLRNVSACLAHDGITGRRGRAHTAPMCHDHSATQTEE